MVSLKVYPREWKGHIVLVETCAAHLVLETGLTGRNVSVRRGKALGELLGLAGARGGVAEEWG